jgi:hypothetical protein
MCQKCHHEKACWHGACFLRNLIQLLTTMNKPTMTFFVAMLAVVIVSRAFPETQAGTTNLL